MNGHDVACAARTYIGARWSHQGRREDALDCAGLVLRVARDLGISDVEITGYGLQATDESMLAACREHLREVSRADLQVGDIVVLRFSGNRHIGIAGDYLHGGLTLIHAQSTYPRRVVEHQFTQQWLDMVGATVAACFRFPEVP